MAEDIDEMLGVDPTKQGMPPEPSATPTRPRGMFHREDYWPYLFGVFVFGGLIAVPAVWSQFIDLSFGRLVAGSLVACAVFAYAHTEDGQFSFSSFFIGYALTLLISLRVAAQSDIGGGVIPGGLLGFLIMSGCGWLGIGLGRATGIAKALKAPEVAEASRGVKPPDPSKSSP